MQINRAGPQEYFSRALKCFLRFQNTPSLYYVLPRAGWANDWDGHYITKGVGGKFALPCHLTDRVDFVRGGILHYGSLWTFVENLNRTENAHNQVVLTVFHGERTGQFPEIKEALDKVIENQERFDRLLVSCSIMEKRFRSWGIESGKIVKIPLGVDLAIFRRVDNNRKAEYRKKYGIPPNALCIGSFQKDGNGWGEGLTAKLIKGPDILVEVVTKLKNDFANLHVLLTGPARGYVKNALKKAKIPFTHIYLDNYHDISMCYACLDLYLVTSREEGGPKAVLESLACGIPLVSTRVGMAPDIVIDGKNGHLTEINDTAAICSHAGDLLSSPKKRQAMADKGEQSVQHYDWKLIAERYYAELYAPLLRDLNS